MDYSICFIQYSKSVNDADAISILQLPEAYFNETLNKINSIFAGAEKTGAGTYTQGCFACLTAYLIYACIDTRYDKVR